MGQANSKIPRSPKQGTHFRCKDVQDATAQMDEYAANKWFCMDSDIGKDIQDDSPVQEYHLTENPRRHLKTYKQRCLEWKNKWKFQADDAGDREAKEKRPSNSTISNSLKNEDIPDGTDSANETSNWMCLAGIKTSCSEQR